MREFVRTREKYGEARRAAVQVLIPLSVAYQVFFLSCEGNIICAVWSITGSISMQVYYILSY